ncbi:MAG: hypothetical protein A7316_03600 [Candidatus Altiarchaeales archaeon WOR_SM1_86-2]|nr:MAG: hypothetical protein A7316_03600 [Candidatus Altiarchaeales archaeon WOR_SM1_86-2]ODS38457.1 MAG: hypothetical protein A7315_12275 [Candidatus Altiarchaeales archaeon WOR_SM1_79]
MIANFRINKIVGERTAGDVGKVNLTPNFRIVSLKKATNETIGDHIIANFEFEGAYKPEVGNIKLEGNLIYYSPNIDELVHEEKKEIELEPEAVEDIMNFVFQNTMVEAIGVAKKLRLPVPLSLPRFSAKKSSKYPKAEE